MKEGNRGFGEGHTEEGEGSGRVPVLYHVCVLRRSRPTGSEDGTGPEGSVRDPSVKDRPRRMRRRHRGLELWGLGRPSPFSPSSSLDPQNSTFCRIFGSVGRER